VRGMKNLVFEITTPARLLDFLFAALPDKSRTTVKSLLTHRQVSVNRLVTTQFDQKLRLGDRVEISAEKGRAEFRHPMLRIVWEDDALIVIDKKYGLLSIATDKIIQKTAYHILSEYVKAEDPRNRIFVLHRLDRETSGLMMFAKSQEIQRRMQSNWNETVAERKYYAVVEGAMEPPAGTITSYLAENKVFKVYATTPEEGKEAILEYKTLSVNRDCSLLEIGLETGRKNQIRAQLESVGHPIAGDKKYGAQSSPMGRVALHAGSIAFVHPVTGEEMVFTSPLPYKFHALFDRKKQG
jgi:23S rRNA pseudouridine1911/1915/1917 synthase